MQLIVLYLKKKAIFIKCVSLTNIGIYIYNKDCFQTPQFCTESEKRDNLNFV